MICSTRLPLPLLALVPALLCLPASAQEQPVDCERSGDALRIEYQVEDQVKERRFKEEGAPLDVRGIEKRVLLLRGNSFWQRETGKDWTMDRKRVDELYKEMEKEFEAAGTTTPRFHALRQEAAQSKPIVKPIDSIKVEVPHPGWSFSYDNSEMYGTKHIRSEDLSVRDAKRLAASGVFGDVLAGKVPDSEVKLAGVKTFAGHSCELSEAIRPARFEYCTAKIAGWEIDLFRKRVSPDGLAVIETAVAVDDDPCVPEGLFELPKGIELIDR